MRPTRQRLPLGRPAAPPALGPGAPHPLFASCPAGASRRCCSGSGCWTSRRRRSRHGAPRWPPRWATTQPRSCLQRQRRGTTMTAWCAASFPPWKTWTPAVPAAAAAAVTTRSATASGAKWRGSSRRATEGRWRAHSHPCPAVSRSSLLLSITFVQLSDQIHTHACGWCCLCLSTAYLLRSRSLCAAQLPAYAPAPRCRRSRRLNVGGRVALEQVLQVHVGDLGEPPRLWGRAGQGRAGQGRGACLCGAGVPATAGGMPQGSRIRHQAAGGRAASPCGPSSSSSPAPRAAR